MENVKNIFVPVLCSGLVINCGNWSLPSSVVQKKANNRECNAVIARRKRYSFCGCRGNWQVGVRPIRYQRKPRGDFPTSPTYRKPLRQCAQLLIKFPYLLIAESVDARAVPRVRNYGPIRKSILPQSWPTLGLQLTFLRHSSQHPFSVSALQK